jgi:hypothetical protein
MIKILNINILDIFNLKLKMAYVEAELPAPLSSEYKEVAWAVPKFGEHHRPIWIARPKVTDHQVKFEMLFCGKFFL